MLIYINLKFIWNKIIMCFQYLQSLQIINRYIKGRNRILRAMTVGKLGGSIQGDKPFFYFKLQMFSKQSMPYRDFYSLSQLFIYVFLTQLYYLFTMFNFSEYDFFLLFSFVYTCISSW